MSTGDDFGFIDDAGGTRAPSDSSLDVVVQEIEIGGEDLRSYLRALISKFFVSRPPVEPSLSDHLASYLEENSDEFRQIKSEVVDLAIKLDGTKPDSPERRKLMSVHSGLMSRRDNIITQTVASPSFHRHTALAKAAFNEAHRSYKDMADCIGELKPYMGLPDLPAVKVPSLEPLAVLQAIRHFSVVRPNPDEMVMMGEEPFYSRSQFSARSIYYSGIHPAIAKSHILVPFDEESQLGREAEAAGAVTRSGRLAFKLSDGRPVGSQDWRDLDYLLPFAARSLTVPLVPLFMPQSTLAIDFPSLFGKEWWKPFETQVAEKHAGVCQVCGGTRGVKATPSWRFIEPPVGAVAPGVMVLDTFYLFCGDCRAVYRPVAPDKGQGISGGMPEELLERLAILNRWTDLDGIKVASEVYGMALSSFERRSKLRWLVNLSLLSDQPLILEPGLVVGENGWIRRSGLPGPQDSFKIVGVSFQDRAAMRHSFPAVRIFKTKWGHTLEEAVAFVQDASSDLVVEEVPMPEEDEPESVAASDDEADSSELNIEDQFKTPAEVGLEEEDGFEISFDEKDETPMDPETAEIHRALSGGLTHF